MARLSKNPHAVALGKLGGAATKGVRTERKAASSRRNGQAGGRPLGSKDKQPRKSRQKEN